MNKVLTIAKRELRSYFDSLVAYVVVGGSMLGLGVWFFLMQQGGFWQIDRASVGRMFEFLPWTLSAMVLPLVTMRSLAEEKRTGTLELLITMPVTDADVILGKYLAALGLVGVLLLATLIYPIALFVFPFHLGALDWGPVFAGYLGTLLLAAAGLGVGLAFSAVSESQIVAFFFTAVTLISCTWSATSLNSSRALWPTSSRSCRSKRASHRSLAASWTCEPSCISRLSRSSPSSSPSALSRAGSGSDSPLLLS